MVVVILALFDVSQKSILAAVAESLQNTLEHGTPNENIITDAIILIEATKRYVLGAIVAMSVVFGALAAHISLKPVRESLAAQKHFISSLAHELRTPLAVLRVENEVAALETPPDAQLSDVLARNLEEIDRITEILNNLLLINRLGALESAAFETVDLGAVTNAVGDRLKELARGRGVDLRIDRTAAPTIYGNATALEQAVFNVTKNAILYSRRGDAVRLYYHAITDRDVTLAVSDSGIGIARRDLPHIFEPFYRSRADANKPGGTGIGLSIVFDIVKLHNGKLHVNSRPGKGTDFYITLPQRPGGSVSDAAPSGEVAYDFTNAKS